MQTQKREVPNERQPITRIIPMKIMVHTRFTRLRASSRYGGADTFSENVLRVTVRKFSPSSKTSRYLIPAGTKLQKKTIIPEKVICRLSSRAGAVRRGLVLPPPFIIHVKNLLKNHLFSRADFSGHQFHHWATPWDASGVNRFIENCALPILSVFSRTGGDIVPLDSPEFKKQ